MADLETGYQEPPKQEIVAENPAVQPVEQIETTDQVAPVIQIEVSKTETPQFVVDPKQNFAERFAEYDKLSPEATQYALERNQSNFTGMASEDAAALLLAADKLPLSQITEELKQRVAVDETAAEFYFIENIKRIDVSELQTEIMTVDSAIQNGSEVPPRQLKAIIETAKNRNNELAPLIQSNTELQQAIERLDQDWAVREQKVADLTQATENIGELEQLGIEQNAEIQEFERNGEEITTKVKNPDGTEKEVVFKKQSVWKLLLIATVCDAALGTNTLGDIADVWVRHNVAAPILTKLGIDPSELLRHVGAKNYEAFNGMLKVMDDASSKKYFEDAVQKNFLFDVLKQTDPEHINKIFNPDGTQAFGKSGFLGYDHLHLDQELVQKMYDSLTQRQRQDLKIPERKAVAA